MRQFEICVENLPKILKIKQSFSRMHSRDRPPFESLFDRVLKAGVSREAIFTKFCALFFHEEEILQNLVPNTLIFLFFKEERPYPIAF